MSKLPAFPKVTAYSRLLPEEGNVHASILTRGNDTIDKPADGKTTTVIENLQRAAKISNDGEFLGEKYGKDKSKYGYIHYQDAINRAQKIGSALMQMGQKAGSNTRIGICGLNCTEYCLALFGCASYSMVAVPLYHNYKHEALREIIEKCEIQLLFCDTMQRAKEFIRVNEDEKLSCLKTVVVMRPEEKDDLPNGTTKENPNISLYEWEYLMLLGDKHLKPIVAPKPDDVYIIVHTSGTTGVPKGVQITHRGLLAALAGAYHQWCAPPNSMHFDQKDVYISYLSLAHLYEQLMQNLNIYFGAKIGFCGDVRTILLDMQALRPTMIAMVPRMLNRLYDTIHSQVEQGSKFKRYLFNRAVRSKSRKLKAGQMVYSTMYDKLVFSKLHKMLGGKLRWIVTGGAPISTEVLRFSRIAYGCPVVEGYGQTECSAAGTLTLPGDIEGGHVGGPAAWTHVKLIDVPELGYEAADDKGEVCFRGAGVMLGYYGDNELTKAVIDQDGWLRTGDIGQWLPNGALKIIDRKKNFFKLAQGDFVSPETVENVYNQHPLVTQIFVYGTTLKSFMVAVVVVDMKALRAWIAKSAHGENAMKIVQNEPLNENVLENYAVKQQVLTSLRMFGAERGLNSLEQVRNVYLTDQEFTAEDGLLTPTMKLRRKQLGDKFVCEIERMYEETTGKA